MTETLTQKEALCPTHGPFAAHRICGNIWSRCPTCSAEAGAKREARRQVEEHALKAAQLAKRIQQAGIPERFADRSFADFSATTKGQKKALAFAREYAEGFSSVLETGRCALFVGCVGTGKTHLAAAIAFHVIREGRTAVFTTTQRAIRRVKDTWRRGCDESESEAIAALSCPDLLVFDEVGVQFGSDAERMILFDILNDRYERRLPTILLSNLDAGGVKSCLGERIFDRLREDGGQLIVFDWGSYRGQSAQPRP